MDMSASTSTGVVDAAESWDDSFEFQPEPGPSTSTSARMRVPAVVENWDDDFAEEDEDEFLNDPDTDTDTDTEAGPSTGNTSTSASTPNAVNLRAGGGVLVSPRSTRSMGSLRRVERDDDSDEESWDEEDEDESWDEDEEEERVLPPSGPALGVLGTLADGVDASLSPLPSSSTSGSTSPADGAPSASAPPQAFALPPLPPSAQSSSLSSPTPAFTPAPAPTSPSTSSHPVHTSSFSSPPVLSPPVPSPPPHAQTEFGSKTKTNKSDEQEEEDDDDEDATITARSRHRRPGTRHVRGHSGSARPPVPAIPATLSIPTFAPPSLSSTTMTTITNTTEHATLPVENVEADEDRGEGPSTRAPVFSPPGSVSVSTPSLTPAVPPAAASAVPPHRTRHTVRPRTADGLQSRGGLGQGQRVAPVRASLDAYRSLNERSAGAGPTSKLKDRNVSRGERERGFLSRLGQGVSRWASTSASNSSSSSNAGGNADTKRRGRGRSNTVTGASASASTSASTFKPAIASRPSVSSRPLLSASLAPPAPEAISRPSLSSSGRPSTSSARPSTSSSASSSSPLPSARPHPASRTAAPAGQRNSIVSLLSMYTHRSRTSSVSVSGSGSASGSASASNSDSRRTSAAGSMEPDEAAPRASISSWTRGLLFAGETRAGARRGSVSGQHQRPSSDLNLGLRQRQSLDVRPSVRPALVEASASETAATSSETKGVLGFFGRRKRSNTVTAAAVPSSGGVKDERKEEDVYANKKGSKSSRSLLLLGRKSSMLLGRRGSQKGGGGVGVKEKEKGKEVERKEVEMAEQKRVEAKTIAAVTPESVFSPPPPPLASVSALPESRLPEVSATEAVLGSTTTQLAPRGMKRRIPDGRASLPLTLPVRADSEPLIGIPAEKELRSSHKHTHSQSTSRSTSHSTSNSLSSIGELRIPSRISQAQVSIRRDLGLVKEFAGKVAELKDLQGSYLKMIESVQGMIDSDNGQALSAVKTPRPRSNTSPALSRPPSRSPLASLFQGPDQSLEAIADSPSPSPTTPIPPPTPSPPLYNSTDLAQRMADITSRYDSWWECAELLIELGNTPPSMATPVSTVRLVPPTSVVIAAPPPPPPTPVATVTPKSRGDTYGAFSPTASTLPATSSSHHVESTVKPSRGRANTFAGNMPVARLRSASTSTASIPHVGANHSLSPSSSSSSSAPSHTWRATTGRHDLSQRQLVLLRQMLGVDQKQGRPSVVAAGPVIVAGNDDDEDRLDESDGESDVEDATWRWGHANTVQLPSPAEEREAYFGIASRKKEHRRPWNRPYHSDIAQSEDEDHELAVYVTPAAEPQETKKSKGMNAIRDMLRTLKRAHPPTPTSSTFPMGIEAPPSLPTTPAMSAQSPQTVLNGPTSLAPNKPAIRRAASLLPLSTTASSARVPSSSSTVSRASKIDPTLAFAMTPDNIKPLLDNAREVRARLGECVADVQALLASAGVDAVPVTAV